MIRCVTKTIFFYLIVPPGVLLRVTGLACVLWTETYGTGITVAFQGREDFLKHTIDFVRSETGMVNSFLIFLIMHV